MMPPHERLYRCLLLILPSAMRREANDELLDTFNQEYQRARVRGRWSRALFWIRMAADLLAASAAEHRELWNVRRAARPPHSPSRLPIMTQLTQSFTNVLSDSRLAFRRFAKMPGWTLVSVGTLALGLAASIVTGVLIRDLLWRPLPLTEPERLVRINEISANGGRWWPSFPNAADWREHARMFDGVGIADVPAVKPVLLDGQAFRVPVSRAARGLFETLGVRPTIGRLFTDEENRPGGSAVAIISHSFWRNEFASRPLDGLTIVMGRDRFTVVGVLPRAFRYLGDGMVWTDPADIWTPMERDTNLGSRTTHGYHVVARLRASTSLRQAQREMNQLAQQLKTQHKQPTQADSVQLLPLQDVVVRRARDPLRLLLYAAGAVLLVSCLNLAATILAQGLNRRRELSVRVALGATRTALARHLLVDTAVLSIPAGAAGLLLAALAFSLIRTVAPGTLPRLEEATIDAGAAGLAFLLSAATACLAGLIPALVLSRRTVVDRLRSHGAVAEPRDQRRLWTSFVVMQVTLTVVLLCGTGLLVRSFMAALAVDVGYDPRHVLAVDVALPDARYSEPDRRLAFYDAGLTALRSAPGVEAVGLTNALPHVTSVYTSGTNRDLPQPRWVLAGYRLVDPGYFEAIGITRLSGSERPLADGAVIDQRLQHQLWEGQNAIGDRVLNGFSDVPLTVSGIVKTVREWDQGGETTAAIYVDFHRRPQRIQSMHFVVRHHGDAASAIQTVRRALATIDPQVPVTIEPLEVRTAESLGGRRLMLVLSGGFAIVAVLLAASGVYAMVAFAVGRQVREAAIRLALGAHPASLRVRVLRQGCWPAVIGVTLGLVLAVPAGRAIRSQLFQVQPADPLVLAVAAAIIVCAAVIASVAPAVRASRVDPVTALRQD